jgi:hypothetical protein
VLMAGPEHLEFRRNLALEAELLLDLRHVLQHLDPRFTELGSRNIPNIGGKVPDTVCGLGCIRNIFQYIPDTE